MIGRSQIDEAVIYHLESQDNIAGRYFAATFTGALFRFTNVEVPTGSLWAATIGL